MTSLIETNDYTSAQDMIADYLSSLPLASVIRFVEETQGIPYADAETMVLSVRDSVPESDLWGAT